MRENRKGCIRALAFLLCLICLLASVPTVGVKAAGEEENTDVLYAALVHYGAGLDSAVIGTLEDGITVSVIDSSNGFYKVDCYDMTGYIDKRQIARNEQGEYYVNCNKASDQTRKTERLEKADALQMQAAVLRLAQRQLGTPYVYGGAHPGGFDCSGFVYYVYGRLGYSLNRCADTQMQDGTVVAREGLQIGDLVFFRDPGSPWLASHVGIYAGDGKMIHAGSNGICYADLDSGYYASRFVCGRRIINAQKTETTELPTALTGLMTRSRTVGVRTSK